MHDLTLWCFGTFAAKVNDEPTIGLRSDQVRALLAFLGVETDRPHSRATLANLLWSEYSRPRALGSLRQALFNLRQVFGAESPVLTITRSSVQLNADPRWFWMDVRQFDRLLAICDGHDHPSLQRCPACLERLTQAAELYRGDFLASLALSNSPEFEQWRHQQQEQRHIQALSLLHVLTDHHLAQRDFLRAQRYAQQQLMLEPWHEKAHLQLMQALASSGQRSRALAQYETCRSILDREFGVKPQAEIVALAEHLRSPSYEFASVPEPDELRSSPLTLRERKLIHLFNVFDVDRKGYIETDDIRAFVERLTRLLHIPPGSPRYEWLLRSEMEWLSYLCAAAGNAQREAIDLEGWMRAWAAWARAVANEANQRHNQILAMIKESASRKLAILDTDGDGVLSCQEYAVWLRALCVQADPAQTFRALDRAGNGFLALQDIVQLSKEFLLTNDPEAPGNHLYGLLF